jgi:hypothetical protein
MGKILSERLVRPDAPIYREPLRGYTPHWTRPAGTAPAIAISYRSVDGCLDDEGPAARQSFRALASPRRRNIVGRGGVVISISISVRLWDWRGSRQH